jgi:transcription antitermination factor NusG
MERNLFKNNKPEAFTIQSKKTVKISCNSPFKNFQGSLKIQEEKKSKSSVSCPYWGLFNRNGFGHI